MKISIQKLEMAIKQLNLICDEIDVDDQNANLIAFRNEFNSDVSVFKKIVTGNVIDAQQKGQPKFEFKPFCKLIFSANTIPRIRDHTGAAQRRLLIIPFDILNISSDRIIYVFKKQLR